MFAHILSPFLALPMATAADSDLPAVPRLTLDPAQISIGKPATVSLSFTHLPADARPALQPAGPYATHALPLPRAASLLAMHGDTLFAAAGDTIYRLDFTAPQARIIATLPVNETLVALQAAGDRLLAATEQGRILVYVVSPGNLELQRTISLQQPVTALAAAEEMAYVLLNRRELLLVTLAAAGNSPPEQSKLALPGAFNALTAAGTQVYLTGDDLGLQIVDVADPRRPRLLSGFRGNGKGHSITVDGQIALVAGGDAGMSVFDVSDAQHIQWLGNHNKLGAVFGVGVYQGTIAVTNTANERLATLDLSDARLPITDSLYQASGRINDLLVAWPYVYAATGKGVERVDFSAGAAIQLSNEGINHGGSRRAFVHDDIAYVADWFSGLHMYDIRDPRAPRHLGNYHTPGSSKGVVVRDGIAFVGDDDHGLQIIDVSDPGKPKKISEVLSTGLAYTLKLVGNLIYLADHRGGFHIIDVADVRHPKLIGSYDTPGKSWALDVADGIAYVVDDSSGLLAFDVRDPGAIKLIGEFNPGGYAEDVKVSGNLAYVAFFDKGFYIVDITNAREPRLVGHTPIPGNARSVSLDGSYAYVAGWESGLQVVDIREPSAPRVVAYHDTDGSAWGLDVYKNHAYVWDWWGGIKVVDINDPLQPRAVGRYQGKGTIARMALNGNYLYAASGEGGMQVYDVQNPLNPIWTTGLDAGGAVRDLALAGGRAYLATDAGIVVADISDPFYARWLSRLDTPNPVRRVLAEQTVVIAEDARRDLLVVDTGTPANPHIAAQLAGPFSDFCLAGSRLYVTSPAGGLTVYGIDAQRQLQPLVRFVTENKPSLVRALGDTIALSFPGRGIQLLQWRENTVRELGWFTYKGTLADMQLYGQRLYAAADAAGIFDIDIANPANPSLSVVYPPTAPLDSLLVSERALFAGGAASVNSVTRLKDVTLRLAEPGRYQMDLPPDLPLGTYQLSLVNPAGMRQVLEASLTVKPAPSNKPKFTLEDFKKIMEQQKLNSQEKLAP